MSEGLTDKNLTHKSVLVEIDHRPSTMRVATSGGINNVFSKEEAKLDNLIALWSASDAGLKEQAREEWLNRKQGKSDYMSKEMILRELERDRERSTRNIAEIVVDITARKLALQEPDNPFWALKRDK